MLVLSPESVTFDGASWEGVESIAIDRVALREVVEVGDLGAEVVFVDVPERRVSVKVVRRIERSELDGAHLGDEGELVFRAGFGRTDAGWSRVTVNCVVTRVSHDFDADGVKRAVSMVAVSADGSSDPVVVEGV